MIAGQFKAFNCEDCPPELQDIRGCVKDSVKDKERSPLFGDIEGHGPLYRCPIKVVDHKTRQIMSAYRLCRNHTENGPQPNGVLLVAGGALDQPHYYSQAFEILDSSVSRGQSELRKK